MPRSKTGVYSNMRGLWSETNWRLDDDALVLPNGHRITLKHILQWRADLIEGRFDLTGKWPGWRIRQQFLIAPGGSMKRGRIPEWYLRHLVQQYDADRLDHSRRQLPLF